jgi:hypothetical protein
VDDLRRYDKITGGFVLIAVFHQGVDGCGGVLCSQWTGDSRERLTTAGRGLLFERLLESFVRLFVALTEAYAAEKGIQQEDYRKSRDTPSHCSLAGVHGGFPSGDSNLGTAKRARGWWWGGLRS